MSSWILTTINTSFINFHGLIIMFKKNNIQDNKIICVLALIRMNLGLCAPHFIRVGDLESDFQIPHSVHTYKYL